MWIVLSLGALGFTLKKFVDMIDSWDKAKVYNDHASKIYDTSKLTLLEKKQYTKDALANLGKTKALFYMNQLIPLTKLLPAQEAMPPRIRQVIIEMEKLLKNGINQLDQQTLSRLGALGSTGLMPNYVITNPTVAWLDMEDIKTDRFGTEATVLGGIKLQALSTFEKLLEESKRSSKDVIRSARALELAKQLAKDMKGVGVKLEHTRIYVNQINDSIEQLAHRLDTYLDRLRKIMSPTSPEDEFTVDDKKDIMMMITLLETLNSIMENPIFDARGIISSDFMQTIYNARGFIGKLNNVGNNPTLNQFE